MGHKKERGEFIGFFTELEVGLGERTKWFQNLLRQSWFIAEHEEVGSLRKSGNGICIESKKVHLVVRKESVVSEANMEKGGGRANLPFR